MIGPTLPRILIVDDERPIRRFLRLSLEQEFSVIEAETGADALRQAVVSHPDLVLLDLGLPDLDGLEVTRRIREWSLTPIIILSVRSQEAEKVKLLDAGADDYVIKPFSVIELQARIRAAFRHCARPDEQPVYQNGDLWVDISRREVRKANVVVALTPTEYEILRNLVVHAGRVLTHRQLIQAVWGENDAAGAHLLRVNVSNLRRKIENDPAHPQALLTEPGVGYRLAE